MGRTKSSPASKTAQQTPTPSARKRKKGASVRPLSRVRREHVLTLTAAMPRAPGSLCGTGVRLRARSTGTLSHRATLVAGTTVSTIQRRGREEEP
eukprot:4991717-Prymnesium_polylepis.1